VCRYATNNDKSAWGERVGKCFIYICIFFFLCEILNVKQRYNIISVGLGFAAKCGTARVLVIRTVCFRNIRFHDVIWLEFSTNSSQTFANYFVNLFRVSFQFLLVEYRIRSDMETQTKQQLYHVQCNDESFLKSQSAHDKALTPYNVFTPEW